MPIEELNHIEFLLSPEAAKQRMQTRAPVAVVHVYTKARGILELDGFDIDHAATIARVWVGDLGAPYAEIRTVFSDGNLAQVHTRFAPGD